jgi:hypothetical protein
MQPLKKLPIIMWLLSTSQALTFVVIKHFLNFLKEDMNIQLKIYAVSSISQALFKKNQKIYSMNLQLKSFAVSEKYSSTSEAFSDHTICILRCNLK